MAVRGIKKITAVRGTPYIGDQKVMTGIDLTVDVQQSFSGGTITLDNGKESITFMYKDIYPILNDVFGNVPTP